MLFLKKGQSTLEYALVLAAVIAALIMMQVYLKRGLGGRYKSAADDIGEQFDPTAFSSEYSTTYTSSSQEEVSSGVTTSKLTDDETTSRSGSEDVSAWIANENLYKDY